MYRQPTAPEQSRKPDTNNVSHGLKDVEPAERPGIAGNQSPRKNFSRHQPQKTVKAAHSPHSLANF